MIILDKPLVEIFNTINSYYMYDCIICEIIEINKSSYNYLFNVLRNGHKFDEQKLPNELYMLSKAATSDSIVGLMPLELSTAKFAKTVHN